MRFVSNSSNLNLGNYRDAEEAIGASREVVIDGQRRTTTAQAYVVTDAMPIIFSRMSLTQTDLDVAKAGLQWSGLPTEGDGVTLIDPAEFGRIGVWDSVEFQNKHNLTDDERREVEQMVLRAPNYGRDYIRSDEAKTVAPVAPWANYDKLTNYLKIAALAAEIGVVGETLEYERANKNREGVIAALEDKLAASAPEGETVLA